MDKFGHTQEQMSQALGKSRSHIANLLRLLNLPDDIQRMLTDGLLSVGHARALIGHPFASALARQIVENGLSVRDAEKLAKQDTNKANKTPKSAKPSGTKDADTLQIEGELGATLGMKVSIDHSNTGEGGKMVLNYRSLDQLDDLLRALGS
jgi:ParB family chromosome partitioning protein